MISAVVLLAGLAAAAGPRPVPRIRVDLHPTLVGRLGEPGNRIARALGEQSRHLERLAASSGLDAVERYLRLLAGRRPYDRIAAGVLARLLMEPGASDVLARNNPHVQAPWHSLNGLLAENGPYGRGVSQHRKVIHQLADAASRSAAVSQIFEGRPGGLELEDVVVAGGRPRLHGAKSARLRMNQFNEVFDHPAIPGAALEVFARRAESRVADEALADFRVAQFLAHHGLGPRHFGGDYFADTSAGWTAPFRTVAVKEKVSGSNALDLAVDKKLEPWQRQELLLFLEDAARAGVDLASVPSDALVFGSTALEGFDRFYILSSAGIRVEQPTKTEGIEAAVSAWMSRFDLRAASRRLPAVQLRILD